MKRLAEKKRKALGHIELEDREDEDGDAGGPAKKVKQVQFYGKEQMQDINKPHIQVWSMRIVSFFVMNVIISVI